MSSADFSNFGSAAINLAGTAYIVGETRKMLQDAERTVKPRRIERQVVRKVRKEAKKAGRRVEKHESILGERFDLGLNF